MLALDLHQPPDWVVKFRVGYLWQPVLQGYAISSILFYSVNCDEKASAPYTATQYNTMNKNVTKKTSIILFYLTDFHKPVQETIS